MFLMIRWLFRWLMVRCEWCLRVIGVVLVVEFGCILRLVLILFDF